MGRAKKPRSKSYLTSAKLQAQKVYMKARETKLVKKRFFQCLRNELDNIKQYSKNLNYVYDIKNKV